MNAHLSLVDAVNDATTEAEHEMAEAMLRGFRVGLEFCGVAVNYIGADLHTMQRFGSDQPMCAGVLLDWKPKEPT
jgi:hypothetical protein